jgi:hypothetical protein
MAYEFRRQIEAVNRIRRRNPEVGQRTLARRIKQCQFSGSLDDFMDVRTNGLEDEPEATIYNRIRRFDSRDRRTS